MAFAPFIRVRALWHEWPSETHFSVTILGACGASALIFSLMFFRSNIISPFRVPIATLTRAQEKLQAIAASSKTREAERQKAKDTDRDGLSDYAELSIYKTSPYLGDSDSDGIPDAIEIAQGTDPNCPAGQSCGSIANPDIQPIYNVSSSYNNLLDTERIRRVSESGADTSQDFILTAPDPSTINAAKARDLLVKSGLIPEEQLVGLSEADMLLVYRATYAKVLQIREGLKNPTETPPVPNP